MFQSPQPKPVYILTFHLKRPREIKPAISVLHFDFSFHLIFPFHIVLAGQAAVIIALFWHGEKAFVVETVMICGSVDTLTRRKYLLSPAAIGGKKHLRATLENHKF